MGHHNRHYAGDRYAAAGVWGAPTSTANFCEEDYAITLYIAEFINTLTNLAYIYFAIRYPGVPTAAQRTAGDKKPAAATQPTPSWTRPDFFAVALWVLGTFSFVFHATLKHATQYGDELAMLVLAGALLRGGWPRSRAAAWSSAAAVAVAGAVYLRTGQILHHVYAFNSMLVVVGVRTLYLIFGRKDERVNRVGSPTAALGRFLGALAVLGLAYFLWQVDLEKCADLRQLRQQLGLPWAFLLELHGWWHVLTALGASLYIRLLRDLDP